MLCSHKLRANIVPPPHDSGILWSMLPVPPLFESHRGALAAASHGSETSAQGRAPTAPSKPTVSRLVYDLPSKTGADNVLKGTGAGRVTQRDTDSLRKEDIMFEAVDSLGTP
jgi:hypothetical protein